MKKMICTLLLVCLMLTMVACGGKDDGGLAGTWALVEMEAVDQGITYDRQTLESAGVAFAMELKGDGTGTAEISGVETEVSYNGSEITLGPDTAPYTLEGDTLKVTVDDSIMVFEKQ